MYFKTRRLCNKLNQYKAIIIYGTGDFAQRIYPQLVEHGLKEKIIYFTQTKKDTITSIDGIPVIEIKKMNCNKRECVVLIAVSKLYENEIRRTLIDYGYLQNVFLTDYRIHYQHLEKDFKYLSSFEEYCEYIADWYVKTKQKEIDKGQIEKYEISNNKYFDREVDNNLIIMICGHLSARTTKIAGALKRKRYHVIILGYYEGINPWCLDELKRLNLPVYNCRCVAEMLYYALQYHPKVFFFEPSWGNCLWAEIMFRKKEYFGKVILALYDVLNDGYFGIAEENLISEKYVLEHADGIVWRWFSKEYLEKKGFRYQGKSIQFLDYCNHEVNKNTILCASDSSIVKLCMVAGYGDEYVDDRQYSVSFCDWARIEEVLEKIGNRKDCIFHFYTGGLSDNNIIRCQYYERKYKNFRFFLATEYRDLLSRLKEYDYGCELYTNKEEPPDDVPIGEYYGSFYSHCVRNVDFDFLNAGLPIITTRSAKMWEYLSADDVVIRMNLDTLDIDYLKKNKKNYKDRAMMFRKRLDIDKNILRLIQFFSEVQ